MAGHQEKLQPSQIPVETAEWIDEVLPFAIATDGAAAVSEAGD